MSGQTQSAWCSFRDMSGIKSTPTSTYTAFNRWTYQSYSGQNFTQCSCLRAKREFLLLLRCPKTKLGTQFPVHSQVLPFLVNKTDPALILGCNHIFYLDMKLCILNVVTHTRLFSKMLQKQCIWIARKEKSTLKKMTANLSQLLWPKIFKQFKLLQN